jgi:hypothetical protein
MPFSEATGKLLSPRQGQAMSNQGLGSRQYNQPGTPNAEESLVVDFMLEEDYTRC